jgi:hypothetical protein
VSFAERWPGTRGQPISGAFAPVALEVHIRRYPARENAGEGAMCGTPHEHLPTPEPSCRRGGRWASRVARPAQNIRICVASPTVRRADGADQNGGYARASYASGGGGASRVPRIAGDVTAGCPCHLRVVSYAPCAESRRLICAGAAGRRGLPYGGSTRFYGGSTRWHGHLGRFTRLRLRCGDWRAAAGGCHCASLMLKRRAAATAVRPRVRPGPGSLPSSFPQVTCLDRSGGPVLPPLSACGLRTRPALAVLAWSGDGSPVWGCTTTSGVQVPPRTPKPVRSPQNGHCLNTLACHSNTPAARHPSAGAVLYHGRQP